MFDRFLKTRLHFGKDNEVKDERSKVIDIKYQDCSSMLCKTLIQSAFYNI